MKKNLKAFFTGDKWAKFDKTIKNHRIEDSPSEKWGKETELTKFIIAFDRFIKRKRKFFKRVNIVQWSKG